MQACGRPVLALLLAVLAMPAAAQDARTAEQRLETVRRELKAVATERRKLEGARGSAARTDATSNFDRKSIGEAPSMAVCSATNSP